VGRHDEPIQWFTFTPDGNRLATLSEAGEIRIWSLATGAKEPLRAFEKTEAKHWMAFNPSGSLLAARSGIRSVHLWDLTGPPAADPMVLRRGEDTPRTAQLAFHPNGQWLATAQQWGVAFWPLSRRHSYVLQKPEESKVDGLAFTPDGRWLAQASEYGGPLRLWPLSIEAAESSRVLLEGGLGDVPSVRVDPVGRRLLVGGTSGRLWLVPWDEGQPQALATDFTSPLSAVAFDPRQRLAAVVPYSAPAAEKVIRVLDLESGEAQVLGPPEGAGDADKGVTNEMRFTPDGRLLSCGTYGLMLWNIVDGSGEVLDRGPWGEPRMAVSPDGRFVFVTRVLVTSGLETESVVQTVYDLEDRTSRTLTSHGQGALTIALDPTGQILVTGDMDGVVRVGPVTGEEPHLLLGHEGWIFGLAVSPDGRWIASASDAGTIRLWPMPDLEKPPFHTLPYEEILAKLRSLTNLRVVEDEESATGYKLEPGPFPGWEEVPTW
jgi:hypothetical protein